ncbi:MAG: AAA family ATPase [Pseudomonadales bacterium]
MQEDVADGYRISDLSDYTDDQLFRVVKSHWGYESSQPFDIIGRLKEKTLGNGASIFFLEEMHSTNDGSALLYPLNELDVRQNVYVGSVNKSLFDNKPADGAWVKARVELSREAERIKHNNPFSLQTVDGGLQVLRALPEEAANSDVLIDGQSHVEEWVIDFYRTLHSDQIAEEGNALQEQLKHQCDLEESRVEILRQEAKTLDVEVTQNTESLRELAGEISVTRDLREKLEAEFSQSKKTMEQQLDTLNQFIEKKAKMLVELDLVGQQEIDSLLNIDTTGSVRQGHDFVDVFSSDVTRAVSYVQTYLQNRGVVYRRHVLEDFFALLTTHDLIILAGDSGSGKTNLVKSFAEAIGGKAKIIPVKPNWTSAEDLLGYYNPLEQKFLSTRFLDALFEAAENPDVPYFVCLDEMNLARVEYYFADFLSLMEERGHAPEIHLYSDTEATHVVSEARNFLSLIDDAKVKLQKPDLVSFLDLLRDEEVNNKLHEMCGFREGDSLLKYHSHLRKVISSYLNTPSSIRLPPNVRIIGAINVDETTHSLSPKILDRAHIMRFGSPLLSDWEQAENEVDAFDLDLNLPIKFDAAALGNRTHYPTFERDSPLVETLLHLVREYLDPLGIEFGLRTVRQARLYSAALQQFGADEDLVLNNIVLHKLLPKLMFDGNKVVNESIARKDLLVGMRDYLEQQLTSLDNVGAVDSCIDELDRVIRNAEANDWVVNYWSR